MSSVSVSANCALIIYSCAVLLHLVASRQNNYTLEPFQEGRIFSWSAEAPLTHELSQFQAVVDATDLILTHVQRIENAIIASLSTGKAPAPTDSIRPCNYKDSDFGRSAAFKVGLRGWPAVDASCVSDVFGADVIPSNLTQSSLPQYDLDDLYEALFNRGKVFKDNIKAITRKVIGESVVDNFTNPDIVWNFPYETPSQRCVLHPEVSYRIDDKWYLSYGISNEPKNAQLPDLGRQTFSEYPRVVNGTLGDNLRMCLPRRPETGEDHTLWTNTTTSIVSFSGPADPWFITRISIDENPAILSSLEISDLFVQQAEDALSASNIAILVLPLGLNLVPVALLADVSTVTMLLYTVWSDILTVIPLGIKGVELISIGSQRYRSVMVRMTGASNGTRPEAAVAELYAAECRAHQNVLPTGIAFLALSIVFLLGGVTAEVLARNYALRQKECRLGEIKKAGMLLSSKKRSKPASVASKGGSRGGSRGGFRSPSVSSNDIQPQVVGTPFRNRSFSEALNKKKGDKRP